MCGERPAVPGQADCAPCHAAYMRGLRKRQRETTVISKADGMRRLREILELTMPVTFKFKADTSPMLQRTLGIIAGLAMRELSKLTSQPRQFAAIIAFSMRD